MSKRKGGSVRPKGAPDTSGGFDDYTIAGDGNNVSATISVNMPADGYLQLWYKEASIAPNVIATATQAAGISGSFPAGPRGSGARAWVVVLDGMGNVMRVGSEVDVED